MLLSSYICAVLFIIPALLLLPYIVSLCLFTHNIYKKQATFNIYYAILGLKIWIFSHFGDIFIIIIQQNTRIINMRLGIFGDVHSNFEALAAAYKTLKDNGCEKVISTGDVVGYCGSPKECIDFFRKHKIISVRGNHDHYTTFKGNNLNIQAYAKEVILWMRNTLDEKYISWLGTLPYIYELKGIQFVHSSLEATNGRSWPYILNTQTALFHFFLQNSKFCFYGHTHIPLIFTLAHGQITIEMLTSRKFSQEENVKYLINPGAVGQPRDFDSRASVVVFDTDSYEITLHRVKYNIKKAQKRIISEGLPPLLAERLSMGK